MKNQISSERLKQEIARLENMIRQERTAFIKLYRTKRQQLDVLQGILHETLETEAEIYLRRDLQ